MRRDALPSHSVMEIPQSQLFSSAMCLDVICLKPYVFNSLKASNRFFLLNLQTMFKTQKWSKLLLVLHMVKKVHISTFSLAPAFKITCQGERFRRNVCALVFMFTYIHLQCSFSGPWDNYGKTTGSSRSWVLFYQSPYAKLKQNKHRFCVSG